MEDGGYGGGFEVVMEGFTRWIVDLMFQRMCSESLFVGVDMSLFDG